MNVACPTCRKPALPRAENKAFPFCCERCRVIDLGGWLSESYRVPVGPDETERDGVNEDEAAGLARQPEDLPN